MMAADTHTLHRVTTGPGCNDTIVRDIECILDISRSYFCRPLTKHNNSSPSWARYEVPFGSWKSYIGCA